MIINTNRDPRYSLFYIGAIILGMLKDYTSLTVEELYSGVEARVGIKININFIYYALDWLYLLSLINMTENKVTLCS